MTKHPQIGGITVDGLNKAVYWIGQIQLYNALLEQIFRPCCADHTDMCVLPPMTWPSLFVGVDFFLEEVFVWPVGLGCRHPATVMGARQAQTHAEDIDSEPHARREGLTRGVCDRYTHP